MELRLPENIQKKFEKALEKAGFAAPSHGITAPEMNNGRTYAPMGKSSIDTSTATQKPLNEAEKLLVSYKQMAVEHAKKTAEAAGRQPTISDYYIAAENVGQQHAAQMQRQGVSWGPQTYADGNNLSFDGFLIRKYEIEPTKAMQKLAMQRLHGQAIQNGQIGQPTFSKSDILNAIRQVNDDMANNPDIAKQLEAAEESEFDLDGDEIIAPLYAEVAGQTRFENTVFSNTTFHPAGTLTKYHTEGASFVNVTFDGMDEGNDDYVKLTGCHDNTKFTNIRGGTIEVDDGADVNKMDISGAHAKLIIGNAAINELDATDAHVVTLEARKGARINDATFNGTTIDMASNLEGSRWSGVKFTNANLCHVELNDAELSNVTFTNSSLNGVDFSNAKISNLVIDGKPITSTEELKAYGAKTNDKTEIKASQEFVAQVKQQEALRAAQKVDFNKVILDTKTPEEKAALLASAPKEPKKDAPKQEKPKAQDNAAGIAKADVGTNKSYYDAMNANIAAAPKEAPKAPLDIAAELGATIAASFKTPAQSAPIEKDPAQQASKTKTESFDRSYFARMSETNGRNIT
jgi:uncharacterized protein YjbI with pentapeptide repeats